ncbi:riboflavin synthase [Anaerosalibacter massiliensis]|uniref:Riboflavin synthase n=1 Tax=Anaerosalibacter massiliensis TaxID=1347392 RepID=A0A9X2MHK7_9FIRM|nr:riboflavin synthase [Anaerosalibacter massiliensis]MCR2043240.1 riboflavin synthase [Anaerosalibacter massiliensis]
MFTGIIEEIGIVSNFIKSSKISTLKIGCNKILEGISLGDSIAVNGICLTVKKYDSNYFEADIMNETLSKTNLNICKIGNSVNLERALKIGDRIGGHIVSGHIDGIGTIRKLEDDGDSTWITIKTTEDIMNYIVYKGSIALDGISLTVADISMDSFKVSVVPHTQKETILLEKKVGDIVNIECDQIGKYIEKFLNKDDESKKKSTLNLDKLKKYGYV